MEDNQVKIPLISKKHEKDNYEDDTSIKDLLDIYLELIESKKIKDRIEEPLNLEKVKR